MPLLTISIRSSPCDEPHEQDRRPPPIEPTVDAKVNADTIVSLTDKPLQSHGWHSCRNSSWQPVKLRFRYDQYGKRNQNTPALQRRRNSFQMAQRRLGRSLAIPSCAHSY